MRFRNLLLPNHNAEFLAAILNLNGPLSYLGSTQHKLYCVIVYNLPWTCPNISRASQLCHGYPNVISMLHEGGAYASLK